MNGLSIILLDPLGYLVMLLVFLISGLALGYLFAFKMYYNPISSAVGKAMKKDMALGLIMFKDGIATIKPVKLDGSYLVDEKGQRLWEVERMNIVKVNEKGEKVIEKGSDKPILLSMSRAKVPLYILHEDNAKAASNPAMILIDPDALISPISAKRLYEIKQRAELIGMLRERSKLRDAMYYFMIFLGAGIGAYLIITALNQVVK